MRDVHVDEYVDLYALGALEPSEQAMVDEHLNECTRCRALLEESKRVTELLTWTPEQFDPPPDLQRRVMARVNQLARIEAPSALPGRPEQLDPQRRQGGVPQRSWFASPRAALRWTAALAVLEALLLGALGWQLQNQASIARQTTAQLQAEVSRLQGERAQLTQANEQLAAENARLVSAAAELQPLAELLTEPGTRLVALSDPDDPQVVRGYVVLRPEDTQGFVTTASLQPLPEGQTYQFWLVEGQTLTSAGTFETDEQGVAHIAIRGERPLGDYDAVGISVEPEGGSPQPTDIVLVQPLEG